MKPFWILDFRFSIGRFERKNIFCLGLSALLFAFCFSAEAQQTGKVARIGILEARGPSDRAQIWEAFRQGLRELGYIEGKNIIIEYRYAEGNIQRLSELAAELVRLKVDIIVTSDAQPAVAAGKITTTIPIVMAGGRDPVEAGLAASLAHPGGNVTGVTNLAPELLGKRLELLKDAVPRISRVAVLNEASGSGRTAVLTKEMVEPARSLGIQLEALEVRAPNLDFDQAFRVAVGQHIDALVISPTPILVPHIRRIVELSTKNRLPTMTSGLAWVSAGALMSYGANAEELIRRAAVYVDKILKGAKPADLPVQRPTKFEFVINLKTAKQIRLTISPNVLSRADKIIK
jgi:putative tryptophan/tyrosine transport system substrate-binding protein